jgi:hypothetical protein
MKRARLREQVIAIGSYMAHWVLAERPRMYRLTQAIRSPFNFQTLLAGLLLCATYAVQAETVLPSGNDGKVQSGTAAPRQLAVLLDDPDDPKGKRYSGYVVWRTEIVQQTGEKPDVAIRADIEIPEHNLKMAISLRRNRDLYLSANHKIEIRFALPPNFIGGGVGGVQGIRMRGNEQARVEHLTGAAAKVSEGFFVFGLSERAYNHLQLIDELSWLDILLIYNNRRWAILTIEEGASGRETFEKALTVWEVR